MSILDNYEVTKFGMLRQKDWKPFDYTKDYCNVQATTIEMAYLRLGYISAYLPPGLLENAKVLELGPATGCFLNVIKKHVAAAEGYDVCPEWTTISYDEALNRNWDVLFAYDVIEHMPNIEDLWKFKFRYGVFSLPNPPADLNYRHLKPNEHLWHIPQHAFADWISERGYSLVAKGNPEDLIRKRWKPNFPNINTFIIAKDF